MPKKKLSILRKYLLNNLGLKFTASQEKDLLGKLKIAAVKFNFQDLDGFIGWLIKGKLNREQIAKLASFLTIGETYFFREKNALNELEFHFLPKIIEKAKKGEKLKRLKIWSAGCATGEEPYSIAILLKRVIRDIENWNITIFATDINPDFLEKAKKGEYSKWSFRGVDQSFKTKYFNKTAPNSYQIFEEIRQMVTFKHLNLITDDFSFGKKENTAFDVILCRNVMIYFSKEGIKELVEKFAASLKEGGCFLVSPVEVPYVETKKLHRISPNKTTVFLKNSKTIQKSKLNGVDRGLETALNGFESIEFEKIKKRTEKGTRNSDLLKELRISDQYAPVETATIVDKIDSVVDYESILAVYKDGDIAKAIDQIEIALLGNANNKDLLYLLRARIEAGKGQLELSEEFCIKALKIDKVNTEAHYLMSTILFEQGKIKEAISSLNSALFLNPDFAMGHFLLGNISTKKGLLKERKRHFNNALKSLNKLEDDEIIDESEGLTARRLTEIINSLSYND